MDLSTFKDLGRVSHLIKGDSRDTILDNAAKLWHCHKSYQPRDELNGLLTTLRSIFPDDASLPKAINFENFSDPAYIKYTLKPALATYGITMEYKSIGTITKVIKNRFKKIAHKIRRKKYTKMLLPVGMHKTTIDKNRLFQKLQAANALPERTTIAATIEMNTQEIEALYQLRKYDHWKKKQVTGDAAIKAAASVTSVIPLIPLDEGLRAGGYFREARYRKKNKKTMNTRIDDTKNLLRICPEITSLFHPN